MASSWPRSKAPIQRLPFELKEQIARDLCDFDLYDKRNYTLDPRADTFLGGHTYQWNPFSARGKKRQLGFQPVYDNLRALSLVSRDLRDPAQRALFAVVVVGDPIEYFKLLRTLLKSQEIRGYIRCLFAISVRNPDMEKDRRMMERSRWNSFASILGPIGIFSHSCHGLQNGR